MVVFFDIDGTIIDDESQRIPESAIRAVAQLGKNGHLAVVNTGRPYSHIDPRIRAMAFQGWVCGCGLEILLNGQVLTRREPSLELCRYVVDSVRQCGMDVLYETIDGAILTDGPRHAHPIAKREVQGMREKGFAIREVESLPAPKFLKLVAFEAPGCRREEFIRRMEPHFTCIDRGNGMLELVETGSSKAGGMELLLNHLGMAREDTLAIGDSTNDLPMFRVAGHTACMGGGMEELKREAEYITAAVMEGGIEKALQHFGLI